MAKILGISGSPRNKSTEYALGEALKSIESRDGLIRLVGVHSPRC